MTESDAGLQAWVAPGRLDGLPPYPLADVPDIKARPLVKGRSVIDLSVGDPGLPVPEAAVETLREAAVGPGGESFVRASLAIEEDRWDEAGRRIREAL